MPWFDYQVLELEGYINDFSSWSRQVTINGYTLLFPGEREVIHFMRWVLVDRHGENRPDADVVGLYCKLHYNPRTNEVTDFS